MILAAAATTGVPSIICTLLLIATIIAFIIGLADAIGVTSIGTARGRFTTLIVAVVLLVIYVVLC